MTSRTRPNPIRRPDLILASTSPFRSALLESAGLPFRAVAPDVAEHASPGVSPRLLARALALEKARAVSRHIPEAWVIGSDQTAEVEGALLRKPRSRAEARRQLKAMAGREHFLHTAVALVRQVPELQRVEVESVRLRVRDLTARDIEAYLDTGEWQGCAGGYRIEGQGIKLMQSIRGDYHAIVGLPVLRLVRMLDEEGFPLFEPPPKR